MNFAVVAPSYRCDTSIAFRLRVSILANVDQMLIDLRWIFDWISIWILANVDQMLIDLRWIFDWISIWILVDVDQMLIDFWSNLEQKVRVSGNSAEVDVSFT